MHNPFNLEGKTILVTGASSGIGRACAIECSKLGAILVINGRNVDRLKETFDQLSGNGHLLLAADITNATELSALIDGLPVLSGVVNNAGIALPKLFSFTSNEDIQSVFKTNFFSPFELLREIIKRKKLSKKSSVVFLSSIAGTTITSAGGSSYGASKSAVNGLAKALALELAGKGIRVNTIMPGMIETKIMDNSSISSTDLEEDRKRYPLKRYGTPEEVAYAVIYLLSDASSWMTGTNLLLDGGYTLV